MELDIEKLKFVLSGKRDNEQNIIDLYDEIYNPKLTLTQLKRMYSTPIFIVVLLEDKCGYKSGWKINDDIVKDYFNIIDISSLFTEKFLLADYEKTWIAFRYEKYIEITNPCLGIDNIIVTEDKEHPNYYYFISDDDSKTGWKAVVGKDNQKIIVENKLDETMEYFYINDYKLKWNAYQRYKY